MKKNETASEYILRTSREYSLYVNEHRAIPKVSDGLKDAQRKALWILSKKNEKIKTISLAGSLIASGLYLHGDASAADTISLMAAPFANNIPLLEGEGTFGTRVAPIEGISAPRYTYVKKSKLTEKIIYQDIDLIPMKENYDGSTLEPETFLPLIPIILLNGIAGIAVGWSTEILPRNIKDIINATIKAIDNKKISILNPSYQYLDIDVRNIEKNVWEFTGKGNVLDASHINITELPPDLTLDKFIKRLITYIDDGKINDFDDNSTEKINIIIKFKRGTVKSWDQEKIINFFKLRTKKTERIVVIDWSGKSIRQYESAELVIKDFVKWRFKYYIKRYEKLLKDTNYELNFLVGIKDCFDKNLPSQLIKMKDKKSVEKLIENSTKNLDRKQIEKISSLPTYRWSKDYLIQIKEKIKCMKKNKKLYQNLLKNPNEIKEIYKQELKALKKENFCK